MSEAASEFRDELPDRCPPDDATEVRDVLEVFRLIKTNPPTQDDFRSQRTEQPQTHFNTTECIARGLSVWVDRQGVENARKLPKFRNTMIGKIRLCPGAGWIMQTFKPTHRTWWPFKAFDPAASCEVVS